MTTSGGIAYLRPPELVRRSAWQDPDETRVANWIRPWDFAEPLDVGLLMVPIARGAIKQVATNFGPNALRNVWPFFTTYSIDYDVDVAPLRVRDLGDVDIPLLDVPEAHRRIEAVARELFAREPAFLPVTIGGEHSLVHPLLTGLKAARGYRRPGLVQFDAHMDLQSREHGPHNGTPIRSLIEDGVVRGDDVAQIGIAGFVQAKEHAEWGRAHGMTIYTARDVARGSIDAVLDEALAVAGRESDGIYVTFDIDCYDQAFCPGTGASLPGGLTPWQGFDSAYRLGADPRVVGFDIVEVDPTRDQFDISCRLATKLLLSFLAGVARRIVAPGAARD